LVATARFLLGISLQAGQESTYLVVPAVSLFPSPGFEDHVIGIKMPKELFTVSAVVDV